MPLVNVERSVTVEKNLNSIKWTARERGRRGERRQKDRIWDTKVDKGVTAPSQVQTFVFIFFSFFVDIDK